MRNAVLFAVSFFILAFDACGFEKLALMDSLDMAYWCDTETREGTLKLIDDCDRPGSTGILWRDKGGGGWMRYPSKEEMTPIGSENVVDKRRVMPNVGSFWALRLDNCGFDVFGFVFGELAKRGRAYGIHQTFEENHTINATQSLWTLAHPQYWCCTKQMIPNPGTISLAYPEALAHKLRFADEHIALKPQKIFLDMWRCGTWNLDVEYVKPNVDRWKLSYPGEPLPDATDERWIRICSVNTMRYLREYGKKCKKAGIDFVLGLATSGQTGHGVSRKRFPGRERDLNGIFAWSEYGIDWKQLAAEGAIDGIWVMNVLYDENRVWASLRETLDYVKANAHGIKCYFGVNSYDIRGESYMTYAKKAKCSNAEAVRNLMRIAKDSGYDGVVYECVDCHCYPEPEVCEELKKW